MDTARKKKVLFLSPRAAIWSQAFPEALLAESLLKSGHEVCYVTCGEVLNTHCEAMDAHHVGHGASLEERAGICAACEFQAKLLRTNLKLPGYGLADVITQDDLTWATRTIEAATQVDVADYQVEGLAVGRAALHGLLRHSNNVDGQSTPERNAMYRVELLNTLLGLAAAKRVMAQEKPDAVVSYDAAYPVNLIFEQYVATLGVPSYSLAVKETSAGGGRYVSLRRCCEADLVKQQLEAWPAYTDVPVDEDAIATVIEHLALLVHGGREASFYAPTKPAEDLRQRYEIPGGAKVLVATLSRYEQELAAQKAPARPAVQQPLLFGSELEWIRAVIAYVAQRPDLFFIVRVHPRASCGAGSPDVSQWEALLPDLPPNVRINGPSDEVSIFDLAEVTDVFLNAGSSAGKEMALLGVPVVLYSRHLVSYPPDLNYVGDESAPQYFEQVERALSEGWRSEHIVKALRWFALDHHWSVFDLRDSYPVAEETLLGPQGRLILAGLAEAAEARLDVYQRAGQLAQAALLSELVQQGASSLLEVVDPRRLCSVSAEQSLALLRVQLRRLLALWHGPRIPTSLSGLFVRLYSFANG